MLLSEGLLHIKGGQIHPLYMQNLLKERETAFVSNVQRQNFG